MVYECKVVKVGNLIKWWISYELYIQLEILITGIITSSSSLCRIARPYFSLRVSIRIVLNMKSLHLGVSLR